MPYKNAQGFRLRERPTTNHIKEPSTTAEEVLMPASKKATTSFEDALHLPHRIDPSTISPQFPVCIHPR